MKAIDNRWKHGKVNLKFPPRDPKMLGRQGVSFQRCEFDPAVGLETYVLILDDPQYAAELGSISAINLVATCCLVETSAGAIAVIVWEAGDADRRRVAFEHFVNPFGSLEFLETAGQQMEIKVIVGDNSNGDVLGFFAVPNVYDFDEFAFQIGEVVNDLPVADFAATQAAYMEEFTIEALLASISSEGS